MTVPKKLVWQDIHKLLEDGRIPNFNEKKAGDPTHSRPTKEEMAAALTKALEEKKPELLWSRLKTIFHQRGWVLVFTPPYGPLKTLTLTP